jgi:4-hydroxy-4-methyl-2-oxoglutarate aldolase
MAVVVRTYARTEQSILDRYAGIGVATVHEAQNRTGLLAPRVRPIFDGAHIAGSAVTVSVAPGDNSTIHVAVEECRPGDVLVVSPFAPSDAGYIGELIAIALQARGVRGVIIDAGCRDVQILRTIRFPVWASAINAFGTVKETLGDVNRPLVCAGQLINPGDVVVADDDGVVVVPRLEASAVLEVSIARDDREAAVRQRYAAGELSLDVSNMREKFAQKGLTYLDDEADAP